MLEVENLVALKDVALVAIFRSRHNSLIFRFTLCFRGSAAVSLEEVADGVFHLQTHRSWTFELSIAKQDLFRLLKLLLDSRSEHAVLADEAVARGEALRQHHSLRHSLKFTFLDAQNQSIANLLQPPSPHFPNCPWLLTYSWSIYLIDVVPLL